MNIGKAVAICENLDSEEHSIEDKLHAIHEVMNMPTHMGVKKDTLIGMIKWLWNFSLEVSESHSGKRIVEISTPHGDLIDRDHLLRLIEGWNEDVENDKQNENSFVVGKTLNGVIRIIRVAHAVIEAEEEQ